MSRSALASRRSMLVGLGATGLGTMGLSACASASAGVAGPRSGVVRPRFTTPALAPLRTDPNRLTRITVCLRPFRPQGPRIEVETLGDKRIVHNYGHGGSGWSLSWGSAERVRDLAMPGGARDVAVIGCGALGLTAALTLLRAGANVTIYAAERTPFTRSARATGVWSPDSRIADEARVAPGFAEQWERMARTSWAAHHAHVGLDGDPVKFMDQYILRDAPGLGGPPVGPEPSAGNVGFAEYFRRLRDLNPAYRDMAKDEHPFPVASVRGGVAMTFNVAEYAHAIATDFLMEGGRIRTRLFNHPSELTQLAEPVIVNCTGYGARALFGDDTVVPVRGQIAWLAPQPEVTYALNYRGVGMVPRADGIVIQANGRNGMVGFGIEDETIDRAEAEAALAALAPLFGR